MVASPVGKVTSQAKSTNKGIIPILKKPNKNAVNKVIPKFYRNRNPTSSEKEITAIILYAIIDFLYYWYFLNIIPPAMPPKSPNITVEAPIILASELLKSKVAL